MTKSNSATWQESNLPSDDLMQRTERTNARTNEHIQDQGLDIQLSYAYRAVDNHDSADRELARIIKEANDLTEAEIISVCRKFRVSIGGAYELVAWRIERDNL